MSYKSVLEMARYMRRNPTPSENIFWSKVRDKRFYGLKFYRQYIIEHSDILGTKSFYISDFYCHSKRTVIEIDGNIHKYQVEYDQIREERLLELGYCVVRFKNEEVLNQWKNVAIKLKSRLLS